ncbi:hypothetical protein [Enterococcus larvae]|uniref:hypothetical protein n=1 Tax=Enterococcus larvae TaxID=2794352 RepID=UPI003F3D7E20
MNAGQSKFNDFMLERSKPEHVEAMKLLLADAFDKAAAGQQTPEFFAEFNQKVFSYLKPEAIEEVKQAMAHFQSQK